MTARLTFNPWMSCPKPNPQARLRLFCFPCAGGTTSAYSKWSNYLPTDVEVYLIQLPGRGYRLEEPPFTRFKPLVQTLTSILRPDLNIPFAFFGHSMGATLSFEIARQLRRENKQGPVHLFACCCPAPQKPILRPFIHEMPEAQFVAELRHRYNAIPQQILQNDQLMQLFMPCLRADFTMLETYVYTTEKPLDCPISVFGGLQDSAISIDYLEAWRDQTCSSFKLQMFPGDHFFLHNPQSPFLQTLYQQT
ncbi:MAG: thioesterase [Stigonema ocellatum SAG 48.90 = DSM 106950]|nr:thioesterase [Stigonema ocellatum SAG 48.90 = DSM 106950]